MSNILFLCTGNICRSLVAEEVADPYGGSVETYQTVCEQIRRLLAGWEPYFKDPAARKEIRP